MDDNTLSSENQSFTLFELNQHLRRVLAFNMREPIWIRCELSEVNFNRGNLYLVLVDRDDYRLRAKANAIIRQRDLERIKKRIGDPLWSVLQIGQQVMLQVLPEYNELFGLSMVVRDLELAFTIGQLELQRLATLRRLEEEQFMELNRQLELPRVPQRIAVISSKEAAGLQDFLEQLHNNPQHYAFRCELFQAAVQGANVVREIVQQIETIEARQNEYDCIVIVRGGGAKIDLMGFDSFEVCKAVATCELPVITGIGHDVDDTLVDLVAHSSLKTPTAVAEFFIQRILSFEASLQRAALDLQQILQQRLKQESMRIDQQNNKLSYLVKSRFITERKSLEVIEEKLDLLSPKKTLERGFVLLYDEDKMPIKSVDQLQEHKTYSIELKDGIAQTTIHQIKKINHER